MSDVTTGIAIPFRTYPPIEQEQLRAYSAASGDPNPIHLDEDKAKSVGLPGIISHGMLIAALITRRAEYFVSEEFDQDGANFRPLHFKMTQFKTRFKAMVLLGDTLSIGGCVKVWDPETLAVTLDVRVKNQREEVVTTGTVKFRGV